MLLLLIIACDDKPTGCDGVVGSGLVLDVCNVCGGDDTSCQDMCGVINGDNSSCLDICGIPDGDNTSCLDCSGIANGINVDYDNDGYSDINGYSCNDLSVLQKIIYTACSGYSIWSNNIEGCILNTVDFFGGLENYGSQYWLNGRLVDLDLSELWESNRAFSYLSDQIGMLSELRYLNLRKTFIKEVPESIGNLSKLTFLDLAQNQLHSLPESICTLPDENFTLYVGGNFLCNKFYFDCVDYWLNQGQDDCCEGLNGEPSWTPCP